MTGRLHTYPMRAYPLLEGGTLSDWALIDEQWHNIAYVFAGGGGPALYIDGRPAGVRAEYAWFDRVLALEEIASLYLAAKLR